VEKGGISADEPFGLLKKELPAEWSLRKRQQNIAGYREAAWKMAGIPRYARNKLHFRFAGSR